MPTSLPPVALTLLALPALPALFGGAQDAGPEERERRAAFAVEPLPRATLAFTGVAVVDVDAGALVADRTVVVADGRIAAVGATGEVEVPAGAVAIDGTGRFLLPGITEMHGHLPQDGGPEGMTEATLFLWVANGVTTVRGMQGAPSQLALRERIAAGELLGPRLVVGSPPLHGGSAPTPGKAEELVRRYHGAGYDLVKVHEAIPEPAYAKLAETARELGIPFGGHVSELVGVEASLAAGQATIDHLDGYVHALAPDRVRAELADDFFGAGAAGSARLERIPELVRLTKESGAAVVPTQVLWQTFLGSASGEELRETRLGVRHYPEATVDGWVAQTNRFRQHEHDGAGARVIELRDELLAAMAEAGVPVLFGTDSPQVFSVPGFSVRDEMRAMVAAGMTPAQVLASATADVGDFHGRADEGRVRAGARADLVLLAANPLEDVGHVAEVEGVVADGRWLSPEARRAGLDAVRAAIGW